MSKHTPGPWRCTKTQDNVIVNEGGDKWIARALIGNKRSPRFLADPEIAAANATLISAAPDMLEALRKLAAEVGGLRAFESELRAELSNTNWNVLMLRLSEADTAISKAEGRS